MPKASPLPLGEGQGEGVAPPSYRDDFRALTNRPVVKKLRGRSADTERKLWAALRSGQLGAKFRRQHEFGRYVLDFYCAEHRRAVEVDGGQHYEPVGAANDSARTAYLTSRGVRMLRLSNLDVLNELDGVLEAIRIALGTPSP